ncbi:MAG: [Clostridia bacterium]|nr:[FeFe] hydrogenase H-cluster maturation GTPase HydF [Clostridia bacterium]
MNLNSTPSANRVHIAFFGLRNAGKSSLVNKITNQEMSVVSPYAGTTTDPVKKSMELLPLGPVVIIDTAGFDDVGELGEKRIEKTKNILSKTDVAVLVSDATQTLSRDEKKMISDFEKRKIPYIIVKNKSDLCKDKGNSGEELFVSAKTGEGIEELKEKIAALARESEKEVLLVGDLVKKGDIVVLVCPIDSSAPKGRIILPQQQVIRDIIDHGAVAMVCQPDEYAPLLEKLGEKPSLVVCDSQVFARVSKETPCEIRLTSFSILMARMKGFLDIATKSAKKLSEIKSEDKILVCEGCTHHRQCEDIGTVKLPAKIRQFTNSDPQFEFVSGTAFPSDLTPYSLIIHCGGCMITEREVMSRMNLANDAGIPFTNYGTALAYLNGILERSIEMFDL